MIAITALHTLRERLNDGVTGLAGLLIFAVGQAQAIDWAKALGLLIAAGSLAVGASREVRGWLDRRDARRAPR